jgi:2-methylcitrate dehydratase PrpD
MRVEAIAADGRRRTVEITNPRGDNTNPMDDAEVAAKFLNLVAPVLGTERAERTLDAWLGIDGGEGLVSAQELLAG